jgi:hypothetical protein
MPFLHRDVRKLQEPANINCRVSRHVHSNYREWKFCLASVQFFDVSVSQGLPVTTQSKNVAIFFKGYLLTLIQFIFLHISMLDKAFQIPLNLSHFFSQALNKFRGET